MHAIYFIREFKRNCPGVRMDRDEEEELYRLFSIALKSKAEMDTKGVSEREAVWRGRAMTHFSEKFREHMAHINAPAPWHVSNDDPRDILDAADFPIIGIHTYQDWERDNVFQLVLSIILAVNHCAGLKTDISSKAPKE
jgi:hypothetical protein